MKHFLLGGSKTSVRSSYIWNSIGGMLNACQSALLLVVISRTNSIEDAGVFSIAYAIACLAVSMGKFGMRNYQATDLNEKYSYNTYIASRIITSIAMMLIVVFYIGKGIWFLDYDSEKCIMVLLLGVMKLFDAIEDIVHGRLQQKGRFDIGAKCMAIRYIITLSVQAVMLVVTKHLVISTVVSTLCSFAFMLYTFLIVKTLLERPSERIHMDRNVFLLLAECLSLALGAFLMMYTTNAPKYAIDEYLGSDIQACFNYIFMPVNIVSVLSTFIYQPLLTKLALRWEQRDFNIFMKMFVRQIAIIIGLVVCVLVGGYFLGIPVLSILYNTDLSEYRLPLMILLTGSGCLALLSYFSVIITIMRKQKWLMLGYGMISGLSLFMAKLLTKNYGLIGAAVEYLCVVTLCMVIFGVQLIIFYRKEKRRKPE